MATCRVDGRRARHPCASFRDSPRILRRLPPRSTAGQFASSATRLLRRPHLRTNRQTRHISHGLGSRTPRPINRMPDYLKKLFGFDGRVAVVIGGTGVLGGELCNGLAQAGAKVVVSGRSEERGKARVAEIE